MNGADMDGDLPRAIEPMRSIKDPIHDFIAFSPYIWSFIDTLYEYHNDSRQFQRLRNIKQLGVSYYVWAGASHNRFEHSIGVAHLAGLLCEHLHSIQPELGIAERDVRCVQLAGLCHDLGHGPLSHLWDSQYIPEVMPGTKWAHEDASEMMFDDLVKKNAIPIDQDDINFVKDLINGKVNHTKNMNPPEKAFLFHIVSNKRNGIDVDKFDYIARDVRAIGDHNNLSARRLINSARVINNEICYHIKDANLVYELFGLRFSNHKRIYNHKTSRAIEHMIVDALKLAEPVLHIARSIWDPDKFVYLTDSIIEEIERSDDPRLAPSREILDRLRVRDIYKCVDWKVFPSDLKDHLRSTITPERIARVAKTLNVDTNAEVAASLRPDDIIVDINRLHHGMGKDNPINSVRFYGKHNINQSFKAEPGELSTLMPASFEELVLRVFTKESRYYGLIRAAFCKLLESLSENEDTMSSFLDVNTNGELRADATVTEELCTPRAQVVHPEPTSKAKSPFSANRFTNIPPNFIPSQSRRPRSAHERTATLAMAELNETAATGEESQRRLSAALTLTTEGSFASTDTYVIARETVTPEPPLPVEETYAPAPQPALEPTPTPTRERASRQYARAVTERESTPSRSEASGITLELAADSLRSRSGRRKRGTLQEGNQGPSTPPPGHEGKPGKRRKA